MAAAVLLDWVNPRWLCVLAVCSRGRDFQILNSQACRDNFFVYRMGFYDHLRRGGSGTFAGEWCSADALTRAHDSINALLGVAYGAKAFISLPLVVRSLYVAPTGPEPRAFASQPR